MCAWVRRPCCTLRDYGAREWTGDSARPVLLLRWCVHARTLSRRRLRRRRRRISWSCGLVWRLILSDQLQRWLAPSPGPIRRCFGGMPIDRRWDWLVCGSVARSIGVRNAALRKPMRAHWRLHDALKAARRIEFCLCIEMSCIDYELRSIGYHAIVVVVVRVPRAHLNAVHASKHASSRRPWECWLIHNSNHWPNRENLQTSGSFMNTADWKCICSSSLDLKKRYI